MILEELQKGINSNPELEFEHGNSRWRALDEQKVMERSIRGFKMMEESENFDATSLKNVLEGLGVLQNGIRAGNNSWPAWAHERVK
jgi:hypothetical protein